MSRRNVAVDRLRAWAQALKTELVAIARASRDPKTPWYAKAVVYVVVGYALSPIDLIPDFIPVIGYLDDLLLLPLGIVLARRLIPDHVLERCRADTTEPNLRRAASIVAALILAGWIASLWLAARWLS